MSEESRFPEAIYRPQTVEPYQGNPWIEALRPMMSDEEVTAALRNRPEFPPTPKIRAMGDEERIRYIHELDRIYEPLDASLNLYKRFDRLLRRGYTTRNPVSRHHEKRLDQHLRRAGFATDKEEIAVPPRARGAQPMGLHLIGFSGVGKSETTRSVLEQTQDQVLVHGRYQGELLPQKQLVYLHFDCGSENSLKSLCASLLEQMDNAAGTANRDLYVKSGATLGSLRMGVGKIMGLLGLGILVVDEVQHLLTQRSPGARKIINFLVALSNTVCLPVVYVGTPEALEVLTARFQLARRGATHGDFLWWPMANDEDFEAFCEALWRYQYTRTPVPLTRDHIDYLHYYSLGVTGLVVALFTQAQVRAIESPEEGEALTPDCIASAAADRFELVQATLEALRAENETAARILGDVAPITACGTPVTGAAKRNGASRARSDAVAGSESDPLSDLAERVERQGGRRATPKEVEEAGAGLLAHLRQMEEAGRGAGEVTGGRDEVPGTQEEEGGT